MGAPDQDVTSYVNELLRVLHEQRDTLNELLAAANRQQEAIMQRDRAAIEEVTLEQNELFSALQGLEYDREQLQRELRRAVGDTIGSPTGNPVENPAGTSPLPTAETSGGPRQKPAAQAVDPGLDFDRLLRELPDAQSQELTQARDEARALLIELTSANETNQQLLAQELALFELYMSVLNPDMSGETYSEPGQSAKGSGSSAVAFDTRA